MMSRANDHRPVTTDHRPISPWPKKDGGIGQWSVVTGRWSLYEGNNT
jgi:hypothetical protein